MKHHLKHSNHSIFRYDLEVFGRTEQELVANLNAFRCPAAILLCGGKMIQHRWRAQRVSNRLTPVPGWMPGRKQKQKAFPSSVKGCNIDNLYYRMYMIHTDTQIHRSIDTQIQRYTNT